MKEHFEKGWWQQLQPFVESEAFDDIIKAIAAEKQQGKIITPKFSDVFRAFRECPWSNLSVLILGMDPYPGRVDEENFVADGLAFSSRYSTKCPKSLGYIYEAIDKDVYNGQNYQLATQGFDLSYLANQGVLLLNCALTLPLKSPAGSHIKIWEPFIKYVLSRIVKEKDMISCILMGADARSYFDALNKCRTTQVLQCEHPSRANYRGGKWYHEHVFRSCDEFQREYNNNKINW